MSAVNEERLRKIEKRVRYADLIKEMFRPTIDKAKQLEMEQRVLKSKHPIRPIRIASEMNKRSGSFADIEKKRTRPRKIKTQSKTVETPKALKKIDYLSERRKLREDQDKNAHEIDEDIEPD